MSTTSENDFSNQQSRLSAAMPRPLIYAELLSNIRQISVIAALDTPCDVSTNVELSANGQAVILHHHGRTISLNLPGQVAPNSQLQKPVMGGQELSWRLPLASPLTRPNTEGAVSNEAPWPARNLEEDMEFRCRSCEAVSLRKGTVRSWKDLPSENWAEMMDFWHCHKPDIPKTNGNGHAGHSHEDPNADRGYGANAKFIARSGVGFVDLTTFLVAESDCSGIEVSFTIFAFNTCPFCGGGYQEGGQTSLLRLDGLVTDTNTLDQHLHFPFRFSGSRSCLPSSSDYGFGG